MVYDVQIWYSDRDNPTILERIPQPQVEILCGAHAIKGVAFLTLQPSGSLYSVDCQNVREIIATPSLNQPQDLDDA